MYKPATQHDIAIVMTSTMTTGISKETATSRAAQLFIGGAAHTQMTDIRYAYDYNINNHTAQGKCAVGQLGEEIKAAGLVNVSKIYTDGDWLLIEFPAALSGPQETALNGVVTSHAPIVPPPAAGSWTANSKWIEGQFTQITAESGSYHIAEGRVFVICTYLVRSSAAVGQGVVCIEVPWRSAVFATGGCACGIAASSHDGIQPTSVESVVGTKQVRVAHTLVGCATGVDLRVSLTFTYKL